MKCPACGSNETETLLRCASCGHEFNASDHSKQRVKVKVSQPAVASTVCALIGVVFSVPGVIAGLDRTLLSPESSLPALSGLGTFCAMGLGFWLGVAGLVHIALSGGRRSGYGFAAIGAATPFAFLVVLTYVPAFGGIKITAPRLRCGTNLSGIGKAMLLYSNDYDDMLPLAGGENGRWVARTPWWGAGDRQNAYGLSDPNAADGRTSISANLYLLVKYSEVPPKSFVCTGERKTREFQPTDYGLADRKLTDLWDFGPNPPRHCSYAYHMPYGPYRLTAFRPPDFAVAADRNPWIGSPFCRARDFSRFKPDIPPYNGTGDERRCGNSVAHRGDGQNVLFLQGYVEFHKLSFGLGNDNIYTFWDEQGKERGIPPVLGSQPADPTDSLLVNDPAVPRP
ncbi:MAG: hypothetical protein JW741_27345 [Sedimentisphaerales bacterium]|nr:hypothetical protein [Sedimentisphaerales bacterium]